MSAKATIRGDDAIHVPRALYWSIFVLLFVPAIALWYQAIDPIETYDSTAYWIFLLVAMPLVGSLVVAFIVSGLIQAARLLIKGELTVGTLVGAIIRGLVRGIFSAGT